MHAVRPEGFGTPEVFSVREIARPKSARGEVSLKISAAGAGFADLRAVAMSDDEKYSLAAIPADRSAHGAARVPPHIMGAIACR
jgi:NADPH:quinone reductase-like Zn-dependent oxidoreductase